MSRAKTTEEARLNFLDQIRGLTDYWANLSGDHDAKYRCEGVAFSMLSLIDGCSGMPAMDISLAPHEDDKQFHIDNDENWYEPGMVINDCMLHDLWHI